jgi:CRISPR type III-B/RAMP module RAMP protein Cmr6
MRGRISRLDRTFRDGKKGVFIRCDGFEYELFGRCKADIATKIEVGAEVEFETAPSSQHPDRLQAKNICLPGAAAPILIPPQTHTETQVPPPADCHYYLPRDTASLLFSAAGTEIQNTALKTQKYLQKPVIRHDRNGNPIRVSLKQQNIGDRPVLYSQAETTMLNNLSGEQLRVLSKYEYCHSVRATLGSRMTLGLGSESILETDITLHHTYGFPYVPGSAVKGAARSFIIRELFGGDENTAMRDVAFANIFGNQGQRGALCFLDVFPAQCRCLDVDIMNPHFAKYYQGTAAPTDDDSPNPIKFYAIPAGAEFLFRICSRTLDIRKQVIGGHGFTSLFAEMLGYAGLGAKTSAGYGWFGGLKEVEVPQNE